MSNTPHFFFFQLSSAYFQVDMVIELLHGEWVLHFYGQHVLPFSTQVYPHAYRILRILKGILSVFTVAPLSPSVLN